MRFPNMCRTLALLAALAGTAAASIAQGPQAGAWPAGPVTVVVPFPAGGSVDAAARIVLQRLAERLGQPVVVDNVPGAAGTIGTQRVVRAKPDGQTLLFAVASPVTVAPLVSPQTVKYDALKDLAPVSGVAVAPFVLVGQPALAPRTTAELVALARRRPGTLNYGTDGVGTSMHVVAELIKQQAGLDLVHVPYKLGPQVLTELAGNQIELAVLPVTLAQPFIKEGRVRAYGVSSRQRWPSLPDVPALAETAELRQVDVESWYGLLAPAQVDRAIVERLAGQVAAVLAEPDIQRKLDDAGLKPLPMPPAQFAAYLARERQALGAVVAAAGIRVP
ncbi:Bug family tripartite tricarboxylate transporter substrate binding protein [Pseudorhodoferax sp.]|uniref:Bug family tripartite tricarboxylate transporter substrate binding protein n=1 Tax=Pseudorhodoferax sp. TaxID=1993553 RepID=UPI0039E48F34